MEENEKSVADIWEDIFKTGAGGEEDLINTATKYTLRLTAGQLKCLSFIDFAIGQLDENSSAKIINSLKLFKERYLLLRQYSLSSQSFILRLYDFHSLRHYIGSGLNIDVKK